MSSFPLQPWIGEALQQRVAGDRFPRAGCGFLHNGGVVAVVEVSMAQNTTTNYINKQINK